MIEVTKENYKEMLNRIVNTTRVGYLLMRWEDEHRYEYDDRFEYAEDVSDILAEDPRFDIQKEEVKSVFEMSGSEIKIDCLCDGKPMKMVITDNHRGLKYQIVESVE